MTTTETIRQTIADLFAEHGEPCVRAVFDEYFNQPDKLYLQDVMDLKGIGSRMTVYNRIKANTLPQPEESKPRMWWYREKFLAEDRAIQARLESESDEAA